MRPISATFLLAFLMLAPVLTVAADDSVEEYRRRFAAVAADDVSGHLRLARWCRSRQLWELLAAQCRHIRKIVPKNEEARLLLKLAQAGRFSRIEDFRPENVCGKHVRRKLNPGKARIDRLSEDANRQGLRETRNPFEQDVAAGQQADQEARNHRILTHENLRHFAREFATQL